MENETGVDWRKEPAGGCADTLKDDAQGGERKRSCAHWCLPRKGGNHTREA